MTENLKQNGNNQDYENEKCPEHNVVGQFIPPPKVDKQRRKLIVTFKCPEGHNYTKEFDLK
jgi:hypothetical protein